MFAIDLLKGEMMALATRLPMNFNERNKRLKVGNILCYQIIAFRGSAIWQRQFQKGKKKERENRLLLLSVGQW